MTTAPAGPDHAAPTQTALDPHSAAHPRLVLLTTILASSLAMIDGSVVNVGLPAIGRSLQAVSADLQWVVNAYLLPLSALLLLGGALGDRFGRRRLLVIGVSLFAAASAGCALAPNIAALLIGRALQGVGAALLLPNSLAILGDTFGGEARGRAIGTWAAVGAMTAAIGPVLGGWLIDTTGWRAIFLLNIPLASGAVVLAMRYIGARSQTRQTPLDLAGAALATSALGLLAWGLTVSSGPAGWRPSAIASTGLGVVLMLAFVVVERRRGDRAMAPLALFGSRNFVGLSLLTLLLYGMLGGLLVLLPYVLIVAVGYSATGAGAALLPFPLVVGLMSPVMGGLAGKLGAKWLLTLGAFTAAFGVLLMLRVGPGASYWTTALPAMLVISAGMSGVAAPLTTAVLASVNSELSGSASGLNSALARTGGLIATALLGAVLAAKGAVLVHDFRIAAAVGAVIAATAGACALFLIGAQP